MKSLDELKIEFNIPEEEINKDCSKTLNDQMEVFIYDDHKCLELLKKYLKLIKYDIDKGNILVPEYKEDERGVPIGISIPIHVENLILQICWKLLVIHEYYKETDSYKFTAINNNIKDELETECGVNIGSIAHKNDYRRRLVSINLAPNAYINIVWI